MSEHRQGHTNGPDREENFSGDDAFIDALSQGIDPTDGTDELAALLLGLREEVVAPMPPTPVVCGPEDDDVATTVLPAVGSLDARRRNRPEPSAAPAADGDAAVTDLDHRRGSHSGWFGHGLIGAAAATLIIAGGGAMVHSAQPGDSLWGINQALFTDHAAVVELTATLEEADSRNAEGDVQGALKLLEQAKALAQEMNAKEQAGHPSPVTATVKQTVTATVPADPVTVTAPAAVPPPVTQTVMVTETVTPSPLPSAPNLEPGVRPTTSALTPPSFPAPTSPAPAPVAPENTSRQPAPTEAAPAPAAPTTSRAEGTHVSAPSVVVTTGRAPAPTGGAGPDDGTGTVPTGSAADTVDRGAPVTRTED
ncbi:hypothetical protein ACFSSC_02010 [Corynebacterium mendelii]|uniref:Anti-sigma-D factor RsdA sigma factor binding region domain-containing protein n=1 Tax=Corynebacterium mendelii TaxID=2765362 RepID=A0A939E242_9CORY|nr:hypothetical protein [Corynebacterium mendelii]MBN9644057.1 hypothetical protein [Corynebacterium mendelii]